MSLILIVILSLIHSFTFETSPLQKSNRPSVAITTYKLENKKGLSIDVLNLGGIIRSIKTPDRNGVFEDIVLGFEDTNHY